ncbi:reactive intermediate/imine deaminase [Brachybacterium endophyticum]|uniref:Reactive intermediate/imine deaminase n=1 Tax=Brachybacterium endophyticum TaxID=2182385 RepID=A0A2U2RPV3_9MICO|nr:reactive intermediate/imine deaminase [Brachybacterium endophyticum]
MDPVSTDQAPAAIGPYSQAVRHGDTVYVSGQIPLDPATGALVEGGIREQTRRAFGNARAILEAAGTSLDKALQVTVLLDAIEDFAAVNEEYATFFTEPYPSRMAYAVAALPKGALIEVTVVAAAD